MGKGIFALALITLGGVLLYLGTKRQESVAGTAQALGHEVATAVDGKTRITDHTLYIAGGGALILVGIVIALRRAA